MSTPYKINFAFSDGESHDATVTETSISLEFCENFSWAVTPIPTGVTGGSPSYTIQVSNDGLIWFDYNALSTSVDIDNAVDDIHLSFTQMRIAYDGTGVSAGTVGFLFTNKGN